MNDLDKTIKKYQEIDEIRIDAETTLQKNRRIYIGVGVLLAGLGIIIITTKKVYG